MEEIKLVQAAGIEFNFEAAKAEIEEKVAPYRSLVFTEDSKKDAKETVAQLRKDQKALTDQIKQIQKEYEKPFIEFKNKAMEIVACYEEPINFINDQVKAFEESRKAEKREEIALIYADVMNTDTDLAAFLPLDQIYDPRWENATATKKKITEEMMNLKLTAKNGIATIKSFKSDKEEDVLKRFQRSLDITEAINELHRYEEEKAQILKVQEEKARAEMEEKIRAEERAKIEAEQKHQQELQQTAEAARSEAIDAFIPDVTDELSAYTYVIQLSADAKKKLEMFMDSVGIDYEELTF